MKRQGPSEKSSPDETCRALAQFCPVPCWIHSQRQILFVSQSALALLGLPESEVLGRSPADFHFPRPAKEERFTYLGHPATFASFSPAPEPERIYQAIGESVSFGVWIGDLGGGTVHCSQEFLDLLGMSMDECKGFGWTKALRSEDREATAEAFARAIRTGENLELEHWLWARDGSCRPVILRAAPVRDQAGEIVLWAGLNLDVGKYKDALQALGDINDRLTRANRELEEFAYIASHDLQEPLRVIRLMAKLVEQRDKGTADTDTAECLALIQQSADRMSLLVRALLEYARVLHALPLPEAAADLGRAIQTAVQNCLAGIEESGATVTFDPMPSLIADEEQMTRVFQNLISNAIKYRREIRPVITITVDERGSEWRFCVADNGQGIPLDSQQIIFEPFKRLHAQEIPGSGLGLSVCKKIVERHGGRIWTESESGQGSLFFFTLPMD